MPEDDVQRELERLRAENERLRTRRVAGEVTIRVSEKGGVSIYGLGRFPVTLYQEQWEKLLAHADADPRFHRRESRALEEKIRVIQTLVRLAGRPVNVSPVR